jgi:hypothetical protein
MVVGATDDNIVSPPRSVASINSITENADYIAENADFISFE